MASLIRNGSSFLAVTLTGLGLYGLANGEVAKGTVALSSGITILALKCLNYLTAQRAQVPEFEISQEETDRQFTASNETINALNNGQFSTFKYIFELLKNTNRLDREHYLPFKPRFLGGTDYIDGVYARDLNKSVMWGTDSYQRPVVYLKFRYYNGPTSSVAIFQRYNDRPNSIAVGTKDGHSLSFKFDSDHTKKIDSIVAPLLREGIAILRNSDNQITDEFTLAE